MIEIKRYRNMKTSIAYTFLLSVLLLVGYAIASSVVMNISSQYCDEILDESTAGQVVDVRDRILEEREQMELAAEMITINGELTPESAQSYVDTFTTRGLMLSVACFLPGNNMIYADGDRHLVENLKFDIEAVKVPYISDINYFEDGDRYCYWAVPITKEGVTCGIMYGIVDLSRFAQEYNLEIYDNKAQLYIVDGSSKKMIANTVEGTEGYDRYIESDSIGIDLENDENFAMGNSGFVKYYSKFSDEEYYACYKPLGIKNWMVIVTLPKEAAFAHADRIKIVVFCLALVEIILLTLYIVWIMRKYRIDTSENQKQLELSVYMFEVQQTLFDAHKDPKNVISALRTVAEMLSAETAFLVSSEGTVVREVFFWKEDVQGNQSDIVGTNISRVIPDISSMLTRGKSVLYYNPNKTVMFDQVDRDTLKQHDIKNVMLVPALDSSGRLVGVIGVCNMSVKWEDTLLLESVVRNFMMALTNLKSYRLVKTMGTEDALTGLLNRNSYQQYVKEFSYSKESDMCCIYLDANGLHELNNKCGHKAGDEMLKRIGKKLMDCFGKTNSYRIGGDEFVVLCRGVNRGSVNGLLKEFVDSMLEYDYHISVGAAWRDETSNVEELVLLAEKRMYEDKRMYYMNLGDGTEARI